MTPVAWSASYLLRLPLGTSTTTSISTALSMAESLQVVVEGQHPGVTARAEPRQALLPDEPGLAAPLQQRPPRPVQDRERALAAREVDRDGLVDHERVDARLDRELPA